jgi:hypothetical protein
MSSTVTGTFGALASTASVVLSRHYYPGPPTLLSPGMSGPIVVPETGMMTATWLQYQTNVAADIAKIKKILGLT